MSAVIKPIETRYKGYRFRSRLEARWAVLFDAIGWPWEYEPEGYRLHHNGKDYFYLPDFLLRHPRATDESPGSPMLYIEVKPQAPTREERLLMELLCRGQEVEGAFAIGPPTAKSIAYGLPGIWTDYKYTDHDSRRAVTTVDEAVDQELNDGMYSIHPYCFRKWGRPGFLLYDEPSEDDEEVVAVARSARFEHGESP